jgi:hypothetical protein
LNFSYTRYNATFLQKKVVVNIHTRIASGGIIVGAMALFVVLGFVG